MTQRIFITGGASGLGEQMALRYAREGWQVAIGDINAERGAEVVQAIQAAGGNGLYLPCDVTNEQDWQTALDSLTEQWGGLDVLVNNAGVATAGGIDTHSLEDWQWVIDINLLGVVRGCKTFVPLFKQQGYGHVVNVASMAGLIHPPMMASYNAVKAAVVALSETLALELPDGVKVSVVCPSFFKTNLGDSLRSSEPNMEVAMNKLFDKALVSAKQVADSVYEGVQAGEHYILPHKDGRQAWWMKRLMPSSRYLDIMRKRTGKLRKTAAT